MFDFERRVSDETEFLPHTFAGPSLTFTEIAVFMTGPVAFSSTDRKLIMAVSLLATAVCQFLKDNSHQFKFHKPTVRIAPFDDPQGQWNVKVFSKLSWIEKKKEVKPMAKKFIQKAHMKKGALHKEIGIPEGKKIPRKTLAADAKKKGIEGKRARFAETLEKFHK